MKVLGIDPGKTGGWALVQGVEESRPGEGYNLLTNQPITTTVVEKLLETGPFPVICVAKSREFNPAELARLILRTHPDYVAYESLHAMPAKMGGSFANFARGQAVGIIQGVVAALAYRPLPVTVRSWQAEMLAGYQGANTKVRARLAVSALYGIDEKHDGIVDAVLIAGYALRKLGGLL